MSSIYLTPVLGRIAHFHAKTRTATVPLSRAPFIEGELVQRKIQELGLLVKPEVHITLIGNATGAALSGFKNRVRKLIHQKYPTWDIQPTAAFYRVAKDYPEGKSPAQRRTSLVQECEVPKLVELYDDLSNIADTAFQVPYPHVTLASNSTHKRDRHVGIGIYSRADLKTLGATAIEIQNPPT
jgi:hypothetical protein